MGHTDADGPVITYAECRRDLLRLRQEVEEALLDRLERIGSLPDEAFEAVSALKVFWHTVAAFTDVVDRVHGGTHDSDQQSALIVSAVQLLIEKSLVIGMHLDVTETAKLLNRKSQTEAANKGKSGHKDQRYQIAKPIIAAAHKKADGTLLNRNKVLADVNKALTAEQGDDGKPIHKAITQRTLGRYFDDWRAESAE